MRSRQEAEKKAPMYDRTCLKLSLDEIEQRKKNGEKCVIRQKIPDQENVVFEDLIRGEVSFLCSIIDDQVLMKSDGFPTYHLANVVDDHLMEVTHVIRGEEWLSSAPKHVLLYEAFGWVKPFFAHIPLLLNKDKGKLSKRQNDVAVEDYIGKGYSGEAILNFIALLGWHPGGTDQEIFSMEEMLKLFSLEKVHKSGAIFDTEKLDWMNWQWRRKRFDEDARPENEKLFELAKPYLEPAWSANRTFLDRVLKTVKEKIIKNPAETAAHCAFYFKDSVSFTDELLINPKMKVTNEIAKTALEAAHKTLQNLESFDDESKIQEVLGKVVADLELKNGQVLWPVRVVLTGEQYSPGVFEVLWGLGKEKALKRIADGLKKL